MIIILQVIAVICVIGGLYLMAHKQRAAWIVYQFGGIAWVILYFKKGLYIAILAQVIFMTMNIYGWIKWGKDKEDV